MEEISPEYNYRVAVLEAVNSLKQMKDTLNQRMLNIAMSGEFKEVDDLFEVGDIIQTDEEMFRNCEDTNIRVLLALRKDVSVVIDKLININNIGDDELDIEITEE